MPIRTDKIYNRNTDQNIDTENLIKYNPKDNTIRNLLDTILIKLDNVQGINVKEINQNMNEWIKKIDDIINEYSKIYELLTQVADITIVDKYLDKINEIEQKLDKIQSDLENKIEDLENKVNETQKELNNAKTELDSKISKAQDDINKILNPVIQKIIEKIYILKDFSNELKNNKITTFIKNGTLSTSKNATLTYRVSRYVFESGNTYVHYCFADTETTNYFDLINPITGKSKRFNSCSKTSGHTWSCCDQHNQDLRYLLEGQNGYYVEIKLNVFQNDVKGFKDLIMSDENSPGNIFYLKNSKSKIIDYTKITDYQDQIEAIALCEMYDGNYPLNNCKKFAKTNVAELKQGRYIVGYNTDTNVNNNEDFTWFQIKNLDKQKYEMGFLTYCFNGTNNLAAWIEFDNIPAKIISVDESYLYDCDVFNDNSSIANYSLDNNFNDSCNKYSLQKYGLVDFDIGKFGNALNLKNKDLTTYTKSKIKLPNLDEITICGWINIPDNSYNGKWLSIWHITPDDNDNNGNSRQPALWANIEDNSRFYIRCDSVQQQNNGIEMSNGQITYNKWHFITQIVKKNSMEFYIDGKLTDTFNLQSNDSFKLNGGYLYIGDKWHHKNHSISNVRIFNRALNQNEINQLFKGITKSNNKKTIQKRIDQSIETYFEDLTLKKFSGDNKPYMVGNGTINLKLNGETNDLSFVIGAFASVDTDNRETAYNHDYIEIITSKGNIIIQAPSFEDTKNKYKILSNNTPYNVDIKLIKRYNSNLPGQNDSFNYSNIYKIILHQITETNVKIVLHCDESFSNEAFGYQINSESLTQEGKIIFDIIANKEISDLSELKYINSNKPSNQYNLWKYNIDLSNYKGIENANVFFDTKSGIYNIIDFYFKETTYNPVYKFQTNNNEIVGVMPHFSTSDLPITWSGKIENEEYFIIPPKQYLGDLGLDYSAYVKFKTEESYYNIRFDLILSGSWDTELYKVKINNKTIFKETQSIRNNKALNFKVPFLKASNSGFKICDFPDGTLSDNNDLILHFDFNLNIQDIGNLQIYNGLNEDTNNEMLIIKNLQIKKLNYQSVYIANYQNKWKGLNYSKNEILATDQIQALILTGKNTFIKTFDNLEKGRMYKLRVCLFGINSLDLTDTFTIKINNHTYFENAISTANNIIDNALKKNYLDDTLLIVERDIYRLTRNKINEFYDINRYNAINEKPLIYAVIEIPFVGTGNDTIDLEFYSNQNLSNGAYGLESVEIYAPSDRILPVFSDNVVRIETGSENNWKAYDANSIYLDVDTSNYGFSDNVMYFANLIGTSSHWETTGATSIYNPSKNGFRVYLNYSDTDILETAKKNKWTINWVGVEYKSLNN